LDRLNAVFSVSIVIIIAIALPRTGAAKGSAIWKRLGRDLSTHHTIGGNVSSSSKLKRKRGRKRVASVPTRARKVKHRRPRVAAPRTVHEKAIRSLASVLHRLTLDEAIERVARWIGAKRSRGGTHRSSSPAMMLTVVTPSDGRYGGYHDRMRRECRPIPPNKWHLFTRTRLTDASQEIRARTQTGVIDGKALALTRHLISSDGTAFWIHTDSRHLPAIKRHVRGLMRRVLQPGVARSRAALVRRLAEIHFWLANAALFKGGNATIVDLLVRTIARTHGLRLPRWRVEEPEVEAFFLPLQRYQQWYARRIGRVASCR
jgi:hypothetical protein